MNRPATVLRPREGSRGSYLELFFDLALIVALSRLSQRITNDLTLEHCLETFILLAAVWWVWTVTTYTTNWYDPETPIIELIVLVVMFGGLLMSAAAGGAFEGRNAVAFAIAYVALHLFRGCVLVIALRGHPLRRRPLRVLIWFAITGVFWIVGAFLPRQVQYGFWLFAVILDYTAGLFGYAVPGLGRTTVDDLRVGGERQSERYQAMFIVGLGEILLVGALNYGTPAFLSLRTVAFILVFLIALASWQLYLYHVGRNLAVSIERSRNPGRFALIAAYTHLVMISGVVLMAAGADLVVADPGADPTRFGLVVLVGGPVLFLAGRALYAATLYGYVRWRLPGGVVLLIAIKPGLAGMSAVAALGTIVGIMLILAFTPRIRHRGPRTEEVMSRI